MYIDIDKRSVFALNTHMYSDRCAKTTRETERGREGDRKRETPDTSTQLID